jgi:probable rRNA maturation factor
MKASDDTVHVHFDTQTDTAGIDLERLANVVHHVCIKFDACPAVVEIQIVDDAQISDVHAQFLNEPAVTDVISFDLTDDFEDQRSFQVVVNIQMARKKAEELGHSSEAELALYITHGLLHNLGFDDMDETQAKTMHQTEDVLLRELGLGAVYYKEERFD